VGVQVTIKNIKGEFKPLNLFQYFDDGIRKRLPKQLASNLLTLLHRNIDENKFGFELSPEWVDYKKRVGADDRPFIMFGYYKKSIQVVTDRGHLSIGFKKTTIHPRAKIPMSKLAVRLEYGDLARGLPARPLWRKTAREFFSKKSAIGQTIKRSIESKGKP
jgi:hypothetical protein